MVSPEKLFCKQNITKEIFLQTVSFDWLVFLCVKWIKVMLHVLVWCIYSHTCTGPVCWWTCSSFPKGKHPVQHYLIWLKLWWRNKGPLDYSLYFDIMGEGNGLAWVPHPLHLLGDCCQFSFISIIQFSAMNKKTPSI